MFTHPQKIVRAVITLITLISLSLGLTGTARAQEAPGDKVVFSQIYSGTRTLRGPQESTSMGFRIPPHWDIPTGGQLDLSFTMLLFGSGFTETTSSYFKAVVNVSLNNIQIGSAIVDKEGLQTVSLPIPIEAWQAVKADGLNDITIQLITNDQCGGASILTIDSSSFLTIPHGTILPLTDLRELPRPFYQNSFYPDAAELVLPDSPTPGDLKAAVTVAAGFGRYTAGDILLTTVTAAELTETIENTSNLIFIGKADAFSQLKDIPWPTPSLDVAPEDGLLRLVVSPWNPAKVLLWVSGTSDAGIVKAGLAFSSGEIRTGENASVAIVSEIHANLPPETAVVLDSSFTNLGYADEEYRQGEGGHEVDYVFNLPYTEKANEDGFMKLVYTNSALLDFGRSGFTVNINGQAVGSGRFTERSTNIDTVTISIPKDVVQPGENRISIVESLRFPDSCARPLDSDLWATIRPESMLHIPLGPLDTQLGMLDLRAYPAIFSPTLDTLAFVVDPSDPLVLRVAISVAYTLGQKTQGTLMNPEVAFANDMLQTLREARSLLVIGRPSKLPILAELTNMPAPFDKGSDIATEPQNELKFRLPSDTPSGYLEIFPSPWNTERFILTVLGNNTQGLLYAHNALQTPSLRNELTGNLAVIYGNNIYATNTNLNATPQPVTIIVPPTATPMPKENSSTGPQPSLVIIGVIAVVIFIFAVIFILMQRKRTPPKPTS